MSNPTPRPMSPALVRLVAVFHGAQKAQARAVEAYGRAAKAAEKAKAAMESAKAATYAAKSAMQDAFLQDVDPMPLVPAPRRDSRASMNPFTTVMLDAINNGLVARDRIS